MGKFIISGFADEISRDLDEQLKGLKELGICHIEPRFIGQKNIIDLTEADAVEVKSKLDAAGVSLSAMGSPVGKIKISDDFDKHLDDFERLCKNAKILDCDKVRIFSFYLPADEDPEKHRDEVLTKLTRLLDMGKKYGLVLCHENEHGIYGESPEHCLTILKHFGGEMKAVFDPCNFVIDKHVSYPTAFEQILPYIEYFHIKDGNGEIHNICPAGEGKGGIPEILNYLKNNTDRDWILTLEPHLRTFEGLSSLSPSADKFVHKGYGNTPAETFAVAANALFKIIDDIGAKRS